MKVRSGYLKRVMGGALFGLYSGHLVFLLNPQIDVTPGRFLPVALAYAAICGTFVGTLLWLLRVARVRLIGRPPGEPRPHGFGYVVAAAFLSALVYWGHYYFFKIYLPPGAVRVLAKATTLLGATSFVLLALWFTERNAEKRTSNGILAAALAVIVASSALLYQRQDRYQEIAIPGTRTAITVPAPRRVTVVAIRNVPYDWIVTARGEGTVPFLDQTVPRSFFTRVQPFNSVSPKAVWASIATGKLPHKHGVTGRYSYETLLNRGEPWLNVPMAVGFRFWGLIPPVNRASMKLPSGSALPIWGMFRRASVDSVVVNWFSSHGTLHDARIGVSERICVASDAATPPAFAPEVSAICRDAAVRKNALFEGLASLPKDSASRVRQAVIADDAAVDAAIRAVRSTNSPLTVISLNSVETVARELRLDSNAMPDAGTPRGSVVRESLSLIDSMLRRMDEGIDDDTLVVICPLGPIPPTLPSSPATALAMFFEEKQPTGSDEGFLLVSGPGTESQPNPAIVQVVDVAPTVLFAAGLPIARDLDGRVVTEAFGNAALAGRSVAYIQSYEPPPLLP